LTAGKLWAVEYSELASGAGGGGYGWCRSRWDGVGSCEAQIQQTSGSAAPANFASFYAPAA